MKNKKNIEKNIFFKKLFLTSSLFLLLTLIFSVSSMAWEYTNWQYRKEITIDHTVAGSSSRWGYTPGEDQINFPFLIEFNDTDLANNAQPDGDDILFTDKEGITKLDHEIEYYDNGHLVAWVNIPILSSTWDTTLYMYYGNPAAQNQENPQAVWDANYLAVYHLEGTSGTVYDSTSNNNDGTPLNELTQDADGIVDGADQFDGSDDRIQLPQIYTTENQFTIEAWIYPEDKQGYAISQRSGNGAFIQFYDEDYDDEGDEQFELYIDDNLTTSRASLDEWSHVVGTYDGEEAKLIVNGRAPGGWGGSGGATGTISWPNQNTYLGDSSGFNRGFLGSLDEIRFSNIVRSEDYITTSYNNQEDPTSFSSLDEQEEDVGKPIISNPTPQDWSIDIEVNPLLQAEIIDPEGDSVDWTIELYNGTGWVVLGSGTDPDGVGIVSAIAADLEYETEHFWRVTATDSGSGETSEVVYSLTTMPLWYVIPAISNEFPIDGLIEVQRNPTLQAQISDPNGDSVDWTVELFNGTDYLNATHYIIIGSGTDPDGQGIISAPTTTVTEFETEYLWKVTATDPFGSAEINEMIYSFTTIPHLQIFNEFPANETVDVLFNPVLQAQIKDYEGNSIDWTIELYNGIDYNVIASGTIPGGEGIISAPTTNINQYETEYLWKVTATNIVGYYEAFFSFTSRKEFYAPTVSNPNPPNEETMINYNPELSVDIVDLNDVYDGTDLLDITFSLYDGNNWDVLQTYNNQPSGTYTASTTGVNEQFTYYLWKVTVTDGMFVTEENFTFETRGVALTYKWTADMGSGQDVQAMPVMGDIDNDGDQEIVMQAPGNRIVAINGKTGDIEWFQQESDTKAPELIDLDGDGTPEVLYGVPSPKLRAVNGDGSIRWTSPKLKGELQTMVPIIGYDLDGDGYPTLYFASEDETPTEFSGDLSDYDGALTMLDHNGNILADTWIYHPCWGGMSIGDVNFDGVFELYLADRSSQGGGYYGGGVPAQGLQAYNAHTLEMIWSREDILHSSAIPVLEDIIGDEDLEVLATWVVGNGVGVLDAMTGETILNYFSRREGRTRYDYNLPTHGAPSIHDIDKDGNYEVIVAESYNQEPEDYPGQFVVFDLIEGKDDFRPTFDDFLIAWPPEVGDVTGDGDMEILAATGNQDMSGSYPLIIYDKKFNLVQTVYPGNIGQQTPARVYDIDSDGLNELIVAGISGTLVAYDTPAETPDPAPRTWLQRYGEYRQGAAEFVLPPGPKEPFIRNPLPADGADKIEFNPTLSVEIFDFQKRPLDIVFELNDGNSWQVVGTHSGEIPLKYTRFTAETEEIVFDFLTEYQWRVTVTDEQGHITQETYSFTSRPVNLWPEVTNLNPPHQSTGVSYLIDEITFYLSDAENELMDYTVTTTPDIGSGSDTNVPNGAYSIPVSGLEPDTTYTIDFTLDDGNTLIEETFSFTTMPQILPVILNSIPEDNYPEVYYGKTEVSFDLYDANGELMDYTTTITPNGGSDSGLQVNSGTYSFSVDLQPATTYTWQFIIDDGRNITYINLTFRTSDEVWQRIADMPEGRNQFAFEELNGLLYSVGGMGPSGHSNRVFAYDPSTDTWTEKAPVPTAFQSGILRAVNGKLYQIGGYNSIIGEKFRHVYEYNPATNSWTQKADMPTEREDMASAAVNGKIYVFSGLLTFPQHEITPAVEAYDPITNTWEIMGGMPNPRVLGDYGTSYNGKAYLVSSTPTMQDYEYLYPSRRLDEYDPLTDTWTRKADMLLGRCYKEAEALDGKIYVISGVTTHTSVTTDKVEVYDIETDTWSIGPDAPYESHGSGLASYNGKIYYCGGQSGGKLRTCYSLDPSAGTPVNCVDNDGDGYYAINIIDCPTGNDCDDSNENINPGADEVCDGIDNDCDESIDEGGDALCDDEAYCNGVETCDGLSGCQPGTAIDCDDSVGCTDDTCNEATDSCDYTPNNALCDDGTYCNGAEICNVALGCEAGTAVDCTDEYSCTDDSCNEATDSCDNIENDANCVDPEICRPNVFDPPSGCGESTQCTDQPDGTPCDNDVYCDGLDECQDQVCVGVGPAINCNDGVGCTDDSCNEDTDSCDYTPNNALCDDGAYCNGEEICDVTLDCQAGTPVDCSDGVSCTDDTCNEATDSCDNTPNDGLCDNGLWCDGAEYCDAILDCQAGTPIDCSDAYSCTDDACDELNDVCVSTSNDANCGVDEVCNPTKYDPPEGCGPAPGAWGYPDWQYRKEIIIDNTKVTEDLENFPVLIEFDDADVGANAQLDGDDILFTSDDAQTQLNHEIEYYDNGNLVAWVNVPFVSSTVDTILYMYYGNNAAANQENPEAVWDANYLAVYHLDETSGNVIDSTSNGNDGTPVNGVTQDANGQIDGADQFDGSDDRIQLPQIFTGETQFTIEGWMNSGNEQGYAISQWNDYNGAFIQYYDGDNTFQLYVNSDSATKTASINQWYYVVGTFDGTTASFYLNSDTPGTTTATLSWPNENTYIGDRSTFDRQFLGSLDEIRFSNIARSDGYIQTSYNNQEDPSLFFSLGVEETQVTCTTQPDGTPCNDGLYCTVDDQCTLGICSGSSRDCNDNVGCTVDSCNEGTDSCDNTPIDAGCDDGLWCNGAEYCDAVLDCQAGVAPDCDDGVSCTDDSCNEALDQCDNLVNDANCDDGAYCNGVETCDALLDCQAGTPIDCSDAYSCTDDSCDEATDSCDNIPNDANCGVDEICDPTEFGEPTGCGELGQCEGQPDGTLCDNGLYCDGADECQAEACVNMGPTVDCDDSVDCTDDSCNEATDSCDNVVNDGNCDNGAWCDGFETCDDLLDCQAGVAPDCDDGVSCTDDSCDEDADECVNSINDANCDDGVGCTDDTCDALLDCQYTPDNANCDNGLWCDGAEYCDAILDCQAGTPIDCTDDYSCTDDACDELNDVCVSTSNDANCGVDEVCNPTKYDPPEGCGPAPGAWGYPDWQYRKEIIIDSTKVAENLENFPVLIEFNDADVGANAQLDGDDILFTSDDAQTQLNHEIEYYNNGNLVAWVNIPSLSSSTDTILYMYYGNDGATNQENVEGVWDSNYLAVYHLDETSGTVYDSTSNNNDGTALNGVNQNINGQINGADQFDGIDDRIQLPQIFTTETQFTIEGWMNSGNEQGYAISQWNDYNGVFIQYYEPDNEFQVYVDDESIQKTGSTNQWSYLTATFDGTTANFYLNADAPGTTTATLSWPNENTYIGDRSSFDRQFLGSLDEIRFSNIARSQGYVQTSYNNQEDPSLFFSLGVEETAEPIDCVDNDGDGYGEGSDCLGADCDDSNENINPGADEICDGIDNNCDTIEDNGGNTLCDDGLYCNGVETCGGILGCQAGTNVDCDDGVGCTDDSCNEATDSCDNVVNDGNCDNGVWCDGAEYCNAALDCQAGVAPDCDDAISCTDDSCNEATDSCDNLVNDANCDDGVGCTDDTCDALLDCQYTPNDANCDDGTYCNGIETCDALLDCLAGTPIDCSDDYSCTDDSCDEVNDECDNTPNDANCVGDEVCDPSRFDPPIGCGPAPGEWGHPNWQYRKEITIDNTKVTEDLENFPVLIELGDQDLKADAQADGDDILFTSDDAQTKLDHEIEYYDNGNLIAWVNVPSLSSSIDTVLYIYYGNDGAANQENAEAVWDSNYLAVYHLDETSGDVIDSTSNDNDGTPINGVTQDADGQIDGADQFDGNNDRIQLPQIFTTQNQFTIDAWINTGDEQGYAISQWSDYNGVFIQYYEPDNEFQVYVNDDYIVKTGSTNQWHYVVATFDGTTAGFYLNADTPGTTSASLSWPDLNTYLGDRSSFDRQFLGSLDEIRFSNIARSQGYIQTSYNNQEDPSLFFGLEAEEANQNPGTCVDNDGDGYGVCPDCGIADGCTNDGNDCDDTNDAINLGAIEVCEDGIDNDCDGEIDGDDLDCGEVTITYPEQYTLFQADANDQSDIPIRGTYSEAPLGIEARFNGGDWQVIDPSPSGGTFSGILQDQNLGQGLLEVTLTGGASAQDSVQDVGIGDVFVIAGQSNAEGAAPAVNCQILDPLNPFIATMYREDDNWAIMSCPIDSDRDALSDKASPFIEVANYITQDTNRPVAFITTAFSGSNIYSWQQGQSIYNNMMNQIIEATDGTMRVKAILFHQGEAETQNSSTYTYDYENYLIQFANDVIGETAIAEKVIVAQIGEVTSPESTRERVDFVRRAQQEAWTENNYVFFGPTLYDVDLSDEGGDGVHFSTAAELQLLSHRWWAAINHHLYDETFDGTGPRILSITATDNLLNLTFDETSLPLIDGNQGYRIETETGILTDANIDDFTINQNKISLTLDTAPTSDVNLSLGSFNDGAGKDVAKDSSAYNLPAWTIFGFDVSII